MLARASVGEATDACGIPAAEAGEIRSSFQQQGSAAARRATTAGIGRPDFPSDATWKRKPIIIGELITFTYGAACFDEYPTFVVLEGFAIRGA